MIQLYKSRILYFFVIMSMLLGAVGMPITVYADGVVSLTSVTTYTENFDTLASSGTASTLPNGWYFSETGGNSTYTAGIGSDNTGDTYSFGSAASSERAFGELTSNTLSSIIGANFSNNTGTAIISLQIGYTGEQWRHGNTSTDQLDFQYSTNATSLTTGDWIDVNSLDFVAPAIGGSNNTALDGNNPANRIAISYTITGLNITNGSSFWIRWSSFNANNSDEGLAVDDFSLTPVLANRAPTDIILSNNALAENQPINAVVGTLSTVDPDAGNTFTYTLATGTGDTDNVSFNISGNELRTSEVFDYETKNSYSVRIRSTDQGGLFFEKAFTITVTDVNDVYIDTTIAHFNSGTLGSCVTDNTIGNGALRLNTASSTSCEFLSRVFDAGQVVDWDGLTSTVQTPDGTAAVLEVRTGNTASPDEYWSGWGAVHSATTFPYGRYVQYRAILSSLVLGQTPVVEEATLSYTIPPVSDLLSPIGPLTSWTNTFSWTGVNNATYYLLEVYTTSDELVHKQWFTPAQAGCSTDLSCDVSPAGTSSLANGNYKWWVEDYGAYGFGPFTTFETFTLSSPCYNLTWNVTGSGTVLVPAMTCEGGYTAGSVIQISALPNAGFAFGGWSGDVTGTSNPVSVTMDSDKNVTAMFRGEILIAPDGPQAGWSNTFSWTGHSEATHYFVQVQKADGTALLNKWYIAAQAGCDTDTGCEITPSELASLGAGDYKWRVRDYGAYGYGPYTPYKEFSLSVACYGLTTNVTGSGSVLVPAMTCAGGYTAGSVIQISALPNAGFAFGGWSGDVTGTSNPVSVTMDGDKVVTALFRGEILIAPDGPQAGWSNSFSWTGHSEATHYFVQVQKADGTVVLNKWYTSAVAGCSGGTACAISPAETLNLGNGDYKWRVRDYGAYGYGPYTPYKEFSLSQ